MSVKLWIDDDRDPRKYNVDAVWVTNSPAAIAAIEANQWDIEAIYFDHDLGGDDTAYDVALYLAERAFFGQPLRVNTIYIHTSNPVGRENLAGILKRWHYNVEHLYL